MTDPTRPIADSPSGQAWQPATWEPASWQPPTYDQGSVAASPPVAATAPAAPEPITSASSPATLEDPGASGPDTPQEPPAARPEPRRPRPLPRTPRTASSRPSSAPAARPNHSTTPTQATRSTLRGPADKPRMEHRSTPALPQGRPGTGRVWLLLGLAATAVWVRWLVPLIQEAAPGTGWASNELLLIAVPIAAWIISYLRWHRRRSSQHRPPGPPAR